MTDDEKVAGFMEKMSSKWQFLLDKSSPHILVRWIVFFVSIYLYLLRVYLVNGWYIVTYGLGIFLLSQSIGFLSPQVTHYPLLAHSDIRASMSLLCLLHMILSLNQYMILSNRDKLQCEKNPDKYLPTTANLFCYDRNHVLSFVYQFDPEDSDVDLGLPTSNTEEYR